MADQEVQTTDTPTPADVPEVPVNELDDLVVRVANESTVVDSGVLLLAELGDHISQTAGDVEKVRRLANSLNIHQHHLAYALTVKNVDDMPQGELPNPDRKPLLDKPDNVEMAVEDGGKTAARKP